MKRSWITGLTLATVAGTGAAFTGVVANSHDTQATKAEALAPVAPDALVRAEPATPTTPTRSVNYQVGAAGTTTLAVNNRALTIEGASANRGWTLASASGPGTHIEVQFTDGTQLVTFGADLVGNDVVVVSLTNAAVEVTPPATVAPAPAPAATPVAVARRPAPTLGQTTAQPQAALPPTIEAPQVAPAPTKAATTAPSGAGAGNGSDDGQKESNDD